jgi:benzoylformate decarboxylase
MATVREATLELFRERGMTTWFGNPGSTELPMLAELPSDFRYVLALHEAVAVGMADGFAQASGGPAHVNLHTAPGVGNAMGAIFNAQANHSPLLVTAGQQVRAQMTMAANLTHREATRTVAPFVKWAYEPPRAEDVPAALAQAIHRAALPPCGPAFVSIPMDDWTAEVADGAAVAHAVGRRVGGRAGADPAEVAKLARRLEAASKPVLVCGPDVDASGAWSAAVALAEKQHLPVWASPAPGGGRLGFPEDHRLFQGLLPPAIGGIAPTLEGHDLVLVVGSSVFPFYPYVPGPLLPDGCELLAVTSDPDEAARAPMGDALVADVRLTLEALVEEVRFTDRRPPAPRDAPAPLEPVGPGETPSAAHVAQALRDLLPDDAVVALEAPTATLAMRGRLRIGRPGSYVFGAGGGLGFGLAAALGVQLARPDRPVVCVLGEGSAQYAITGMWTAAAYGIPVQFLVLRNGEYGILKWFAAAEQVTGAPGLDLPALDTAAVAAGYGVASRRVAGLDELRAALAEGLADPTVPRLLEVDVAPGMSM